jgi:hypothetical protein
MQHLLDKGIPKRDLLSHTVAFTKSIHRLSLQRGRFSGDNQLVKRMDYYRCIPELG